MANQYSLTVKVDDKNLKRRLRKILNKIDDIGKLSVNEIGKFGRDQIQMYMPKDTGDSARSINYTILVNRKGYHEVRIEQVTMPHGDRVGVRGYKGEWFNIPLWMFTGNESRVIEHYSRSNGSIIAMRGVKDTLRKEFKRKVEVRLFDPSTLK